MEASADPHVRSSEYEGGEVRMEPGCMLKGFLLVFTEERLQRMPTLKHYLKTGEIE